MSIEWDAPGQGEVGSYEVTCSGGEVKNKNDESRTANIEDLTAGTEYTITIKAVINDLKSQPYVENEYTSKLINVFVTKANPHL